MTRLEEFNLHRSLLFGIAWRMLGNTSDAEDILQDAFLRWQQTPESDIRSVRSFLVTIVTRLCLNHLDRAYVKREQYCGTEIPAEGLTSVDMNPAQDADLADALDAAFLVVLQCLSPIERVVFLLREVFDRDYSEVARIVEKSEDNCRQILRRARERITGKEQRFQVPLEQQERILSEFLAATETGKLEQLAKALADDAVLICDSANLGAEAPPPVSGAEIVSRYLAEKSAFLFPSDRAVRKRVFRGMPLHLVYCQDQLHSALIFVLQGGLIQKLFMITCPVRLRVLSAQFSPLADDVN